MFVIIVGNPHSPQEKEMSWPDQNQLLKATFYFWRSKGVSFRRLSLPMPWRHIMGIRGIYLLIFKFVIRRKWVVNITLQPLITVNKPWYSVNMRSGLDDLGREKSLTLFGIGTPHCPAHSLVTVLAPLPSSFYSENSGFQYTLKPNLQTRYVFSRPVSYSGGSRFVPYLLATATFYEEFSQFFETTTSERQLFGIDR